MTEPMLLEFFASSLAACSVVPAILFFVNLRLFQPPDVGQTSQSAIAVLIPARDEELNIQVCLESVLASRGVELEVLVYDDESTDRTAILVQEICKRDARVKLITSTGLPSGWNGKQHACWKLAYATQAPELLFLDADVRLDPNAIARCAAERRKRSVALLSGFPRQITIGIMEKLLLPLINFVLLALLPMARMRNTTKPAYSAGCGQFLLVERERYFACGGHQTIRETRHDGVMLPRLFREHGFRTDLVDLTELAEVRMYGSAKAVWQGLAKNATEGFATPLRIVPFTLLMLFGQVLPVISALCCLVIISRSIHSGMRLDVSRQLVSVVAVVCISLVASYLPRLLTVHRFKQSFIAALLHPVGVAVLVALQWYALAKQVVGRPVRWRTRNYPGSNCGT